MRSQLNAFLYLVLGSREKRLLVSVRLFVSALLVMLLSALMGCGTNQPQSADSTSKQALQQEEHTALNSQSRAPAMITASTRRIVFLGDSITHQGGMVTNFSLWLRYLYPNREFELINIGLPSETVTGLSEEGHAGGDFPRPYLHNRLEQALARAQPDLVIAMFGINCGIYESYTAQKQQLYETGMLKLDQVLLQRGVPVLYMTPPMFDHQRGDIPAEEYNGKVLAEFSHWLLSMRRQHWEVVDLYSSMNKSLAEQKLHNPDFYYQHDGIHFTNDAYWLLTTLQASYFFKTAEQKRIVQSVDSPLALASLLSDQPQKLLQLSDKKMQLSRDAWLDYTGHTRPGLPKGIPIEALPSAEKKLESEIQGIINQRR